MKPSFDQPKTYPKIGPEINFFLHQPNDHSHPHLTAISTKLTQLWHFVSYCNLIEGVQSHRSQLYSWASYQTWFKWVACSTTRSRIKVHSIFASTSLYQISKHLQNMRLSVTLSDLTLSMALNLFKASEDHGTFVSSMLKKRF